MSGVPEGCGCKIKSDAASSGVLQESYEEDRENNEFSTQEVYPMSAERPVYIRKGGIGNFLIVSYPVEIKQVGDKTIWESRIQILLPPPGSD